MQLLERSRVSSDCKPFCHLPPFVAKSIRLNRNSSVLNDDNAKISAGIHSSLFEERSRYERDRIKLHSYVGLKKIDDETIFEVRRF